MHELSMAQGIINAVLDTASENNATEVTEVTVEVGRLAMINPEQLQFILGVLIENSIMEDAKINFEDIPAEIKCYDCDMAMPYWMTVTIMRHLLNVLNVTV